MNKVQNAKRSPARKRKLSKQFLVVLSLVLLMSIAGGATLAYLTAARKAVTNSFEAAQVSCRVNDDNTVTNNGDVDAYIRAAVVVNWQNSDGEIRGIAPVEGTDYTISSGWKPIGGYLYYSEKVAPGASVGPVCTVTNISTPPTDFTLTVEVVAEAIQAVGTADTETSDNTDTPIYQAWGMLPEGLK